MTRIIGISGSLRSGSYNTAMLRTAAELAPEGVKIEIASIRDIPLYDGDIESSSGVPQPVKEIQDLIAGADGILLACPEYNGSITGVLKNALDWLTRPPKEVKRVFAGKATGIIGATPGLGGTRLAQASTLGCLHGIGVRVFSANKLYVAGAGKVFDEQLRLTDDSTRKQLEGYLSEFSQFATCCK